MKIYVRGVEVILTEETIFKTRQYYSNNAQICIDKAVDGTYTVNDLDSYVEWQLKGIADCNMGLHDHTFAFIQMAYYIQSGECVPLLSK